MSRIRTEGQWKPLKACIRKPHGVGRDEVDKRVPDNQLKGVTKAEQRRYERIKTGAGRFGKRAKEVAVRAGDGAPPGFKQQPARKQSRH